MEKRVLGRTGLWVSKMGLGTGQFGAFGQTIQDHLAGQDVTLTDEVLDAIDALVPPGTTLDDAAATAAHAAAQNKSLRRQQHYSTPNQAAGVDYVRRLVESEQAGSGDSRRPRS